VLLIGLSAIATAWMSFEGAAAVGMLSSTTALAARVPLALLAIPFAVGAAAYTAFLFAQCEGRDLWQSPLLPLHLLVQAAMLGAAAVVLLGVVADVGSLGPVAVPIFAAMLALDLLLVGSELGLPHASEVAARAAHAITRGRYARQLWGYSVGLGHVAPLVLLATGIPALQALAGALAVVGLYAYEHAFVMAPQEIPNS
jgi:formate-dependent nitrite reductase membrane component NrfD